VGDKVGVSVVFRDLNNTPVDTVVSSARVRRPDGTEVDLTGVVAHTGTGAYMAPYVIDQGGRHWFKFRGTNPLVAAPEDYFDVALERVG